MLRAFYIHVVGFWFLNVISAMFRVFLNNRNWAKSSPKGMILSKLTSSPASRLSYQKHPHFCCGFLSRLTTLSMMISRRKSHLHSFVFSYQKQLKFLSFSQPVVPVTKGLNRKSPVNYRKATGGLLVILHSHCEVERCQHKLKRSLAFTRAH